jgi:hypothetical protein
LEVPYTGGILLSHRAGILDVALKLRNEEED